MVIGELVDVDLRSKFFWGIRRTEDGVGGEAEYYEWVQEIAENGEMVDVENEADCL